MKIIVNFLKNGKKLNDGKIIIYIDKKTKIEIGKLNNIKKRYNFQLLNKMKKYS